MKGSEKQIKWAQDIVAESKKTIEWKLKGTRQRMELDSEKYPHLVPFFRASEAACLYALEAIDKLDDAKEIIDNRGNLGVYVSGKTPKDASHAEILKEYFASLKPGHGMSRIDIISGLVG